MVDGTPFGRYRLLDMLGQGGMGEVWRAHDTVTDRVVALKVLPSQLARDPLFQERFRREAKAAASLDEPHVVPIHDFGEIDGNLFVSMRLVNGSDLQAMLAGGPLDPKRAVLIVEQVAAALSAAHEVRLVHRDVKPSNILVTKDDFAYLIDFGIARGIDEKGLTNTGAMVGTLHYMAPERLTGDIIDGRSDVYALTCVLHQCLTGRTPFPGDTLERQITGHLTTPPPQPSVIRYGLPRRFDEVIAKGMAKNPEDRVGTTAELAKYARWAVSGESAPSRVSVPSAPVSPPRATPPPVTPPPVYRPPTPPQAYAGPAPQHQPAGPPQYPSQPRTPTAMPQPVGPSANRPEQHLAGPLPKRRTGAWVAAAAIVAVAVVAAVLIAVYFGRNDTSTASGTSSSTTAADTPSTSQDSATTSAQAPSGAAPTLVSPSDGSEFDIYPRTTTLEWTPGATGTSYLVEIQFQDPSDQSWNDLDSVTIYETTYTFDFVGAQPGRWRVTATDVDGTSATSDWWTFNYLQ